MLEPANCPNCGRYRPWREAQALGTTHCTECGEEAPLDSDGRCDFCSIETTEAEHEANNAALGSYAVHETDLKRWRFHVRWNNGATIARCATREHAERVTAALNREVASCST